MLSCCPDFFILPSRKTCRAKSREDACSSIERTCVLTEMMKGVAGSVRFNMVLELELSTEQRAERLSTGEEQRVKRTHVVAETGHMF
jgi:hypothetical protein